MASLRVSSSALSRKALTSCRPRLYLGARCVVVSARTMAPRTAPPNLQMQMQTQMRCSSTAQAGSLAPKIERGGSKLYKDADAAVADIKSGSTILSSGFGLCGVAGELELGNGGDEMRCCCVSVVMC